MKEREIEPMESTGQRSMGRRAILAGAFGGVLGLAAKALGVPDPAEAASGDPVILGNVNSSAGATIISNDDDSSWAQLVVAQIGVLAANYNADGTAIQGYTQGARGFGLRGETGGDATQTGVMGRALNVGVGVLGTTTNGIGVMAAATGGYGLQVKGRAVFDRSGRVTIKKGVKTKTISGKTLSSSSIVLTQILSNVTGMSVRVSMYPSTSKFVIRLNKAAPKDFTLGWFIVN